MDWSHFEKGSSQQHPDLVASAVSFPDVAATCDSLVLVTPTLRDRTNVETIFPLRRIFAISPAGRALSTLR